MMIMLVMTGIGLMLFMPFVTTVCFYIIMFFSNCTMVMMVMTNIASMFFMSYGMNIFFFVIMFFSIFMMDMMIFFIHYKNLLQLEDEIGNLSLTCWILL